MSSIPSGSSTRMCEVRSWLGEGEAEAEGEGEGTGEGEGEGEGGGEVLVWDSATCELLVSLRSP